MRIYLAGPLFTQAERAWNQRLAEALKVAGHTVILPQEEVKALACPDADKIFQTCVNGVCGAEAVVAILDGPDPDSGTAFECGVAYSIGMPIVVVRTDFRGGGDALPGQRLATVNLMLAQAAAEIIHHPDPATTFEAVAMDVIRAMRNLRTDPQATRMERFPR